MICLKGKKITESCWDDDTLYRECKTELEDIELKQFPIATGATVQPARCWFGSKNCCNICIIQREKSSDLIKERNDSATALHSQVKITSRKTILHGLLPGAVETLKVTKHL